METEQPCECLFSTRNGRPDVDCEVCDGSGYVRLDNRGPLCEGGRVLDLDKLEEDREAATIDKVDLFDFYNANWDKLVEEIRSLRAKLKPSPGKK